MIESTTHGKWAVPGVPHRDWRCVDVVDEGSDWQVCQMCERRQIRFVHVVEHDNYPVALRVGSGCAGHLTGDSKAAENREKRMKSRALRRVKWPTRAGWTVAQTGNDVIRTDGYRVTIRRKENTYSFVVVALDDGNPVFDNQRFGTKDEAKLAAFDYLWPARISN